MKGQPFTGLTDPLPDYASEAAALAEGDLDVALEIVRRRSVVLLRQVGPGRVRVQVGKIDWELTAADVAWLKSVVALLGGG